MVTGRELKKGNVIGAGFKLNPLLPEYNKMLSNLGFTPSDFNMTHAAIEKAKSGKKAAEGLESLAEMMGKAKDRKLEV